MRTEDLQRVALQDLAAVAEQVRARPQVAVVVVLEATMPCFAEGMEQTAIEPSAAAGRRVLGVVQLAVVKMSFEEAGGNVRARAVHVGHQVEDVLAQGAEEVVWLLDLHCRASEGAAELELDRTSNQDPSRRGFAFGNGAVIGALLDAGLVDGGRRSRTTAGASFHQPSSFFLGGGGGATAC